MSGYTYLIVAGILTLVGSILGTLGISKLKRQEEVFSLSVPPSIEIMVEPINQKPNLIIENTGSHELVDIRVAQISYVFETTPTEVLSRDAPGITEPHAPLKPRQRITIPVSDINFTGPVGLSAKNPMKMMAIVVAFRRKLDNKRYVEIEPFLVDYHNSQLVLFSLYSGKGTALSSLANTYVIALKEMIETEKLFFRAN
jgi:hypothetical protein